MSHHPSDPDPSPLDAMLPAGWKRPGRDFCTLVCPCGHTTKMDGVCPQGCENPMRSILEAI